MFRGQFRKFFRLMGIGKWVYRIQGKWDILDKKLNVEVKIDGIGTGSKLIQ